MEKQILILLAAYKGGRFIRPMVDSILAQDVGGWKLILSDDGEDTAPILQEYADRYPDRITHYRSGRRFGSAQKHFMHLLEQFGDQADYVMFCDQDDVWHPDKVRLTLRLMEQVETDPSLPVLVHTDLRVVDGQLREMDPSFQHYSGLDGHRLSLPQLLVQNVVTGCTVMINRSLARLACRPVEEGDMLMHDWWLALIAAAMGRAVFLNRATIDYRQHGGNVVGAKDPRSAGYVLQKLDFALPPIILGVILGGMIEKNFRRALILSNGDVGTFFTRPISCVFIILAVVSLFSPVIKTVIASKKAKKQAAAAAVNDSESAS